MTLDKFSKEDLFKLFGKARKENRALRQENETLKGKNRDLFKALNASSEQNEVLQVTNQHLREEYNSLKAKLASMNTASSEKHRKLQEELNTMRTTNEEKLSLIKTQAASYMDEINRLNEEIDQLKRENEKLHADNEGVQSKIGEQYSEFTIKINTLKQTINQLEKQMSEHGRERELFEAQIDDLKSQIATYDEQIAKYKDIARKAQTELDRIESLEEELRDKIRDNHQAQIKTRALNQNIEKLREKLSKQTHKIQQLEEHETERKSQLEQLQKDNESYKENNKLLNEKLNILLRENAESTLKTEHQIENIENYHLSKYKTLLKSFQSMKKRIDAQHKMKANHFNHNHSVGHASNAYSNQGWKKYHEDHAANFNLNASNMNAAVSSSGHKHLTYSIDLEMDEEEFMDNINDLNENISELSTPTSLRADDNTTKQLRKYKNQMKEYKHIISSLQTQMKDLRKSLEIERNTNKKFSEQTRRLNKPKNINIDYLRNVLVKFLILSEYLTDEQVVLVPVLGSILNLTKTEKEMIDNSYNSSRYFMGTNTLFPESAEAQYSPQKKKKRKKKRDKDKMPSTANTTTNIPDGDP